MLTKILAHVTYIIQLAKYRTTSHVKLMKTIE